MSYTKMIFATLLFSSFSLRADTPQPFSTVVNKAQPITAKAYSASLKGMAATSRAMILLPVLSLMHYSYLQKRKYCKLKNSRLAWINGNAGQRNVNENNWLFIQMMNSHIAIVTTHVLAAHYLKRFASFLDGKAQEARES